MYAWDSVVLELEAGGGAGQGRDESGRMVTQTNTITHLQPDTAYVAKIKVSERGTMAMVIAQCTRVVGRLYTAMKNAKKNGFTTTELLVVNHV